MHAAAVEFIAGGFSAWLEEDVFLHRSHLTGGTGRGIMEYWLRQI